jgi:hypothetical protein
MARTTLRSCAQGQAPSLAADLVECLRALADALLDPYRPERHYMRGRGPKWHAKNASGSPSGIQAPVLLSTRAKP